jgi:hypothetical protein
MTTAGRERVKYRKITQIRHTKMCQRKMHKLVDFLTYILQLGEAGASGLSYLSLSFGLLDCTIL